MCPKYSKHPRRNTNYLSELGSERIERSGVEWSGVGWRRQCGSKLGPRSTVTPERVSPIMAYTGMLRTKGVPFSGFRCIKGEGFHKLR